MDIREKAGALEAFQKQLKKDNKGKIVEVDREEIFSIETITIILLEIQGLSEETRVNNEGHRL